MKELLGVLCFVLLALLLNFMGFVKGVEVTERKFEEICVTQETKELRKKSHKFVFSCEVVK